MSDALSGAEKWIGQFSCPRPYEPEFLQASLFANGHSFGGMITERAPVITSHSAFFISTGIGTRQATKLPGTGLSRATGVGHS